MIWDSEAFYHSGSVLSCPRPMDILSEILILLAVQDQTRGPQPKSRNPATHAQVADHGYFRYDADDIPRYPVILSGRFRPHREDDFPCRASPVASADQRFHRVMHYQNLNSYDRSPPELHRVNCEMWPSIARPVTGERILASNLFWKCL
jgi:hypothetical protein